MKNEKIKNTVLAVLILCILGYMYYYFYLKSELEKISKVKTDLASKKMYVQKLNAQKATIDKDIRKAKERKQKLDESIPDVYDKKVIISYFYNLIKESGLSSDRITFSEGGKSDEGYRSISVNFKVDGEYVDVRDFIKSIEDYKRKFVIKQANISQNEKGTYNTTLLIEFYSLE